MMLTDLGVVHTAAKPNSIINSSNKNIFQICETRSPTTAAAAAVGRAEAVTSNKHYRQQQCCCSFQQTAAAATTVLLPPEFRTSVTRLPFSKATTPVTAAAHASYYFANSNNTSAAVGSNKIASDTEKRNKRRSIEFGNGCEHYCHSNTFNSATCRRATTYCCKYRINQQQKEEHIYSATKEYNNSVIPVLTPLAINTTSAAATATTTKAKTALPAHVTTAALRAVATSTTAAVANSITKIATTLSPASFTFKFRHRKCKANNTPTINVLNNARTFSITSEAVQQEREQQQHLAANSITTTAKAKIPLKIPNAAIKNGSRFQISRKVILSTTKGNSSQNNNKFQFRSSLSGLKATSLFSLLTLICLETVLLSTVSNCAKTFYMHWNTSNSIFRIDNTDHIIDVNKGNLAFEFDQVHIICPVYEPGTYENETEKYIIYNVSKVEYETCRITNADPRVIAICDKPQKLMFFTITFRPFTPQPGGLEFLPGNDYYFISTSSKDDLYRRIGGRCSTNNMKVVFKVCCAPEVASNQTLTTAAGGGGRVAGGVNNGAVSGGGPRIVVDAVNNIGANGSGGLSYGAVGTVNQQHTNSIGTGMVHAGTSGGAGGDIININNEMQHKMQQTNINAGGTSINTNIDQYNRIPTNGINGYNNGIGSIGNSGILLPTGSGHHGMGGGVGIFAGSSVPDAGGHYTGQQKTGIRINNVPTAQHPSHTNNNNNYGGDLFNKHPNEVVKNEELTYNSAGASLHHRCNNWLFARHLYGATFIYSLWTTAKTHTRSTFNNIHIYITNKSSSNSNFYDLFEQMLNKWRISDKLLLQFKYIYFLNVNPIIIISLLLATFSSNVFKLYLSSRPATIIASWRVARKQPTKSSYKPMLLLFLSKHSSNFCTLHVHTNNNIMNNNNSERNIDFAKLDKCFAPHYHVTIFLKQKAHNNVIVATMLLMVLINRRERR